MADKMRAEDPPTIQPASGPLVVFLPGLGAVSTTFVVGVEAVRRGLAQPFGSLTQMQTIRVGPRSKNIAPLIRETGWHLLGTCKMGTDPATSVVDVWGRSHDIPNLYIFDGSIWPTSSGMNPTATIAAMSLRCADHLVQQQSNQKVPA